MNKKKKIPLSNSIDRLAKRGSCIPLHLQGRTFEPLYSHPLFGYRRQWVHMSVNVLEKKKDGPGIKRFMYRKTRFYIKI